MSEASSSRSRVTITLGNSGQVVKRVGAGLDGSFPDSQPAVGSKRSVRDRLGSNVDATQLDSKRHRGGATNGVNDVHLGKDDLRFKIMQKNVHSQTQGNGLQNGMDLRDLLSRPARPSTTGLGTQQCINQMKNARQHLPEHNSRRQISDPRDGRQHLPKHRDLRRPDPRDARQHLPEHMDSRRQMPDLRDARQHMMEPKNAMQHMTELNNASVLGRIPSVRSADAFPQMNSLRTHSSPWNLDSLRRKSPDGAAGTSRGLSPLRNNEELHRRPLMRHDDIRTISYMRKDVHELSRPLSSAPSMTKPATSVGPPKHIASMVPPPPPLGGIVQKSSYAVEEQLTVDSLLHSLGLDKYAIYFKAEEVDMAALRQMGDNDLKELGIPMGPRKKILLALVSRSKR